jgi:hypothetical protein
MNMKMLRISETSVIKARYRHPKHYQQLGVLRIKVNIYFVVRSNYTFDHSVKLDFFILFFLSLASLYPFFVGIEGCYCT